MAKDWITSTRILIPLFVYVCRLMLVCDAATPTITTNPESQTVLPGNTVTLRCVIAGKTSDYLVAWMKDGLRITRSNNESLDNQHVDTSRFNLVGSWADGDYTLQITQLRTLDAGTFSCAVNDGNGNRVTTSEPATVTVEYEPDENSFRCMPSDVRELRVGIPLTFVCRSDNGNPRASLAWSHDSMPVNASEDDTGSDTSLTFQKYITEEDNGKIFECKLTYKEVTRKCTVGPLDVIYKPKEVAITTATSNVIRPDGVAIIDINSHVIFTCNGEGSPEPEYSWTVTEAPGCSRGQGHFPSDNILSLGKATMAYNGATIECRANNTVGKSSARLRIQIRNDADPNALCYPTTPRPMTSRVTPVKPTKAPVTGPASGLTTLHVIIIVIAAAFLIIVLILGYIAISRRRESPVIQVIGGSGLDDTRSIAEIENFIFQSRHNTPDPEHRGNSLGRMQSNFSTLSYDTQSIDSATALMHLKSMESPEYRPNPKLTGSPARKLKALKEYGGKDYGMKEFGKEVGKEFEPGEKGKSPHFHPCDVQHVEENVYEGSPRHTSTPTESPLSRQPSEHKYEVCPPLKRYATHASQTDLTEAASAIEEKEEMHFSTSDSDDDDDFDYNPPQQNNFSLNNCNLWYSGKHTDV